MSAFLSAKIDKILALEPDCVFGFSDLQADIASALVRQFLERMQVRDLEAAKGMLAAGFEMTFPGAAPMREFSQLLDWAKTRYSKIGKQYERFERYIAHRYHGSPCGVARRTGCRVRLRPRRWPG